MQQHAHAGRVMISQGMTMLMAPNCEVKWMGLYAMQGTQPKEIRDKYLSEVEAEFSKW
jgi:hypothetical protein